MAGIAATQIPKIKLDTANKKPTAKAGLSLINDERFRIIIQIFHYNQTNKFYEKKASYVWSKSETKGNFFEEEFEIEMLFIYFSDRTFTKRFVTIKKIKFLLFTNVEKIRV